MKKFFIFVGVMLFASASVASDKDLREFIWTNKASFHKSSSKTISPVIDSLLELNSGGTEKFLLRWLNKELWFRKSDGLVVTCLLYTSPSPRDVEESRMPSSA